MFNIIYKFSVLTLFILSVHSLIGQDILEKSAAVNIAMENNFDIQLSNNNVDVALNNARSEEHTPELQSPLNK